VSRTPFDFAEAEQELVAGFHTEYSSTVALLQMSEYVNMITVAVLATNLFLGGWSRRCRPPAGVDLLVSSPRSSR